MEVKKVMLVIAITMALSITITLKTFEKSKETTTPGDVEGSTTTLLPSRSLSRFLAEEVKNPRAASHCHKNKKMCEKMHGKGWECCNNKCVDVMHDKHNCGGCKKKCKYTGECCRGQCVDVAYDKRHCGQCNNRCKPGKFCVYGMCEYA
ncbi:stigma-specific STIG1-like protein 3 [Cucurbita maxima]|uniref:Stigma-specific STIG1-like protein 3 n=1 Tax=Cucurbita maxima TaxID=3661 RepID=A0A6J1HN77_CUCMA|nr:stigma-specific STIG1-like protein 3 [Cucurbita maxima]